jgi:hypothetical protein
LFDDTGTLCLGRSHLNVPESDSKLKLTGHRIVWMTMAAAVPEIILWWALQWTTAHYLVKIVTVAKLIVRTQLLSFVVQVIARPVTGLPGTLLELRVLAHLICAFCCMHLAQETLRHWITIST